ncbi:hypothetical protein BT67DRAFT_439071 [Trichocladium antarcticum]|uniref:Heterokaryon incompatibility domain-containing protein n=1 Tax=Trichocladium antarcticum TaxID=1450529 RepID=A0AAN6US19_9PEZI|nr:hypothetical protein BT67DRAFT_439071 [Trichocladium antarcticum]
MGSFVHPPLPVGVDAIRILTVQPGDFYDPIDCTLAPAVFSTKPRYVALSYTWGLSYPDNAQLPTLPPEGSRPGRPSPTPLDSRQEQPRTPPRSPVRPLTQLDGAQTRTRTMPATGPVAINGHAFALHHNLHLALLHLRSPTHPIPLWIDAICIDQTNVKERNAQVAIMSFIYLRADKVVAWLGAKEYRAYQVDPFRVMAMGWKTGQSRHLGEILDGTARPRYSFEPDRDTFVRITESSYWVRLWIVQEACLPRCLVFLLGSDIWAYEDMREWEAWKAMAKPGPSLPATSPRAAVRGPGTDGAAAMARLLGTREARHTQNMSLEVLIEAFANQACTELRDRIFALLGLAIDVRPFSTHASMDSPPASPDSRQASPPGTQNTRRGWLKVDYFHSIYNIWADVVTFIFSRPGRPERWGRDGEPHTTAARATLAANERRISIVRTAGVVQEALGQAVETELARLVPPKTPEASAIRAMGYLAGEITQLGPACASLASSFHAYQDWLDCRERHDAPGTDPERLRRIDDEYMAKIMRYGGTDLARVREIRSAHVVAWPAVGGSLLETRDPNHGAEYDRMWAARTDQEKGGGGPVLCLGTRHLVCLVPSAARVGDVVVRFWDCDAAVLMRPTAARSSWMLVGRADVAEVIDRKATPGRDLYAEQAILGHADRRGAEGEPRASGAVLVDFDLLTLQAITASIIS